jgi:hypothetical protein
MGPAVDKFDQLAIDTATEPSVRSGLEVHQIALAVIRFSGAMARLMFIAHPGAPHGQVARPGRDRPLGRIRVWLRLFYERHRLPVQGSGKEVFEGRGLGP